MACRATKLPMGICSLMVMAIEIAFSLSRPLSASQRAFVGYELLSCHAKTQQDVELLTYLGHSQPELDFWQPPGSPNGSPVLVPPHRVSSLKWQLDANNVEWTVVSDDIDRLIDEESDPGDRGRSPRNAQRQQTAEPVVDHSMYKNYDKFKEDLYRLHDLYPSLIDLEMLDHPTHEERPVMAVKVTGCMNITERLLTYAMQFIQRLSYFMLGTMDKWFFNMGRAMTQVTEKSVLIVEGGIHAREWISPAAILFVIHTLVQGYKAGDPDALFMLDFYDWYFIPVANPDGYVFSHAERKNRFWRKNRRRMNFTECIGVDLNRNFDFHFGTHGVSVSECSEIYHGHQPFSEPETRNIRDLFTRLKHRVSSYLAVHSYGQIIIVPWCYRGGNFNSSHMHYLNHVAELMAGAILDVSNETYIPGTLKDIMNESISGSSIDWALEQNKSIFSYGFELRPSVTSEKTFLLPAAQIEDTGQELLAAIRVLARLHAGLGDEDNDI